MFWILHGEDEFRRSEFLKKLIGNLGDPATVEINTTLLDGRRASLSEITHACGAIPFLGKYRLVIIEGLLARLSSVKKQARGKKKKKDDENEEPGDVDSPQASFLEEFKKYLLQLPESTALILVEDQSIPASHSLRSFTEGASAMGKIQEFKPFSASRKDGPGLLSQWIKERAKSKKLDISSEAVAVLAAYVGYDLRLMDQELDKLSAYANTQKVSVENVRQLVTYVREADIFEMVDALGRRDTRTAITLLHQMLDEGKAPLYLLTMIVRQFRIILQVKELRALGYNNVESARQLKLHEFVVQKGLSQARNFSFEQLSHIYDSLAEVDTAIKTGKMNDVLALDLLLAEVCIA